LEVLSRKDQRSTKEPIWSERSIQKHLITSFHFHANLRQNDHGQAFGQIGQSFGELPVKKREDFEGLIGRISE
jgi:hypothetical protein